MFFLAKEGGHFLFLLTLSRAGTKQKLLGIEPKGEQERRGWVGDFSFFHPLSALSCVHHFLI